MDIAANAKPRGPMASAISDAVVGLFRLHIGKGPTKAKTYIHDDLVVCVLRGGYSRAEVTLRDMGRADIVHESRSALQLALERELRAAVERITGRRVEAFMSANHLDPELSLESFVLVPRAGDGAHADGLHFDGASFDAGADGTNGDGDR